MNAIIVDDVEKSVVLLRTQILRHCPEINVVGEAYRINEAIQLIGVHHPQVVFLDIELSEGSGFDLLERINERHFHVILVTAHAEFALKAFRFSVTDYLLKPVNTELLKQAVRKVKDIVQSNVPEYSPQTLRVPSTDGGAYLPIANVIRLEAEGPYTHIYVDDGKHYMSSHHLKKFESTMATIDVSAFVRVYRSHLINKNKIKSVSDRGSVLIIEMKDNSVIEVSRRNKQEVMKMLKLKA
ncbi:MAG: response regulator transcription factor [Saprospiraceae bacterium]|nr:response regulator transcription factor [Saprospiraceae bacterium]